MLKRLLLTLLVAVVAPVHVLLALVAPGTQLVNPAHVLLRMWETPPGPVVELAVMIVEFATLAAALAAIAVGVLSLPIVAVIMATARIVAWFGKGKRAS